MSMSDASEIIIDVEDVKENIIDVKDDKKNIIDVEDVSGTKQHPECCIYKVPSKLREVREEAYTPKFISIGPVHHNKKELANMGSLKLRYFKEFFNRTWKGQKEFANIIEERVDYIRHCYAEEISSPGKEDFVKMILVDSIFIIELFLRTAMRKEYDKDDYILSKPWLAKGIRRDLILLENQLPFSILDDLYRHVGRSTIVHKSFLNVAWNYFFPNDICKNIPKEKEVKHFTDLHRYIYYSPKKENSDKENSDKKNSDKENSDKENSDKKNSDKENSDKEKENSDKEKENSDKENSDKENSEKENSDKKNSDKENSDKEKENSDKEKENSEKENSDKENSEKENSDKENSDKENSDEENSDKEKENSEKENSEKENGEKENSDKENSEKKNSDKENSEKENSEKENTIAHPYSATKLDTAGLNFKKWEEEPSEVEENTIAHPYSATKLDTAGLNFKKWEEEPSEVEDRRLLDIQINKPDPSKIFPCFNCSWLLHCLPCLKCMQTSMIIPAFMISHETEHVFRNIMALEQCHYPFQAYICNYIVLLDFLINTRQDAELLVHKKIIVHSFDNIQEVVEMVKKLTKEIVEKNSCFSHDAELLNDHYDNWWKTIGKHIEPLKTVYFRDIWRGTSTIAAIIVLLVTIGSFLTPFFLNK